MLCWVTILHITHHLVLSIIDPKYHCSETWKLTAFSAYVSSFIYSFIHTYIHSYIFNAYIHIFTAIFYAFWFIIWDFLQLLSSFLVVDYAFGKSTYNSTRTMPAPAPVVSSVPLKFNMYNPPGQNHVSQSDTVINPQDVQTRSRQEFKMPLPTKERYFPLFFLHHIAFFSFSIFICSSTGQTQS